MDPDSEAVDAFMGVLGGEVDPAVAQRYLEVTGGDVEAAIALYLESGGGGDGGCGGGGGGGNGASSASLDPNGAPRGGYVDEEYELDDDGNPVRKADSVKKARLLDASPPGIHGGGGGGGGGGLMGAMMGSLYAPSALTDPFRHFGAEARGTFGRQGEVGDAAAGGISELFQPPLKLVFKGSFVDARATAKEQKKWLLVNLQREDVFASHVLNRDVWKDELVSRTIQEGFIFWQHSATLPESLSYMARYHLEDDGNGGKEAPSDLPHIGLLDPRTQRLVWSHGGEISASDLLQRLTEIISRYSLDDHTSALPPPMPAPSRRAPQSAYDRSEDEQLALALAASMKDAEAMENKGSGKTSEIVELDDDDDDDDNDDEDYTYHGDEDSDVQVVDPPRRFAKKPLEAATATGAVKAVDGGGGGGDGGSSSGNSKVPPPVYDVEDDSHTTSANKAASSSTSSSSTSKTPSGPSYISLTLEPEPPAGPGVTRMAVRLPDGKKLVRRFRVDAPVAAFYKYAHDEMVAAGGGGEGGGGGQQPWFELETTYPKASLQLHLANGMSIAEAKLESASLSVALL